MLKWVDRKAFILSCIAVAGTTALVFLGSRKLQNYDAALIAYLFGTLFAVFGIVYRYTVWIQRPPTKIYFKSSMGLLFSKDFVRVAMYIVRDFGKNIVAQRFIKNRGLKRWIAHLLMAVGCTMAFAITVPLTFGWIHFDRSRTG